MPRVPTLNGPRVQETAQPSLRQTVSPSGEVFGGGQSGRAADSAVQGVLGGAANKINRIRVEEKKKADTVQVMSAVRQATEFEIESLTNPETGALNTKGKNAFGATESTLSAYEDNDKEIQQGLTNEAQRAAYGRASQSIQLGMKKKLLSHEARQSQVYDLQETNAFVQTEQQAAISNYGFQDRIDESINKQKEAVFLSAERNGLPVQARDQLVKKAESSTHSGVISQMLVDNKDQLAVNYLKNNRKNMLPEDIKKLQGALDVSTLRGDSQRITDKIMASTDDRGKALDKAMSITDSKKRDAVVARVKSRFADEKASLKDAHDKNFNSAYSIVDNGGTIEDIPPEVLSNLSPGGKQSLQKVHQQRRNGLAVVTDIKEFYNLEQMALNPSTRDAFLKTNLLEKAHQLSQGDFKKFASMQSDLRNKGQSKTLDGIETKTAIVNNALLANGIKFDRKADKDSIENANLFRSKVDQLVVQRQQQTGRKVTNDELRQITDDLMVETITGEGFFGFFKDKTKVFALDSVDAPRLQAEDVPRSAKDKISASLRKRNIPVTEENIMNVYLDRINKIRQQ